MRVITGTAKGHTLKAPKHMHLRPTPSRVKEAIFSSYNAMIPDARVLELFAGTGAFSIETLSRGAESSIMVEKDRRTVSLIEQNLKKTHLESKARVISTDVRQALEWLTKEKKQFDIIFADPPYQKSAHLQDKGTAVKKNKPEGKAKFGVNDSFSWTQFLLDSPLLPSLLAPKGILMIEFFKKEVWKENPAFQYKRDFSFGDTVVAVFMTQGGVNP
jgi:16S rRNA (guanine(966)-N(2))-methyltransferase RsmD